MAKTDQALPKEEIEHILTIWEKTIDVQMHFNDISMRIRNLFISVMLAVVGAIGWVIDKGYELNFFGIDINFSMLLLLAGMISAYLFLLMDKYWYHQLLKGAVAQAQALDEKYGTQIPSLGLTSQISAASPIKGFKKTIIGKASRLFKTVKSTSYAGDDLRSNGKVEMFYLFPIRIFQILFFIAIFAGGFSYNGKSIVQLLIDCIC